MSSDTMYFNSSRLLPTTSRNKTPPVKQKQKFSQSGTPLSASTSNSQSQKKGNNNHNNNSKAHTNLSTHSGGNLNSHHSSVKNKSDYIGKTDRPHQSSSSVKPSNKNSAGKGESNKKSNKNKYSKVQQLPNGEKPDFGHHHSQNGSDNNKKSDSHRRNNSGDFNSIIKDALENNEEKIKPSRNRDDVISNGKNRDSKNARSKISLPNKNKTQNKSDSEDEAIASTKRDSLQESPLSPKTHLQNPALAPPVLVAAPVASASPLVQPINHMVNMHPHHPAFQNSPGNHPAQMMMMQPPMFPNQLQRDPQHYSYNNPGNAQRAPMLPMQMHLSIPLQPGMPHSHPNFDMNGGGGASIMLHPGPPQVPQPHFMNMYHQPLQMTPQSNFTHPQHPQQQYQHPQHPQHQQQPPQPPPPQQQQSFAGIPSSDLSRPDLHVSASAPSMSSCKSAAPSRKPRERRFSGNSASNTTMSSSPPSVSASQYAGASFTINAPTITKLPKPSFI